jgi:nicotinate phosphoribosyltransferase
MVAENEDVARQRIVAQAVTHQTRHASGGLGEFEVEQLLRAGAPIDAFGLGTKVGLSGDAPWTDCAYKLVEYAGLGAQAQDEEKNSAGAQASLPLPWYERENS